MMIARITMMAIFRGRLFVLPDRLYGDGSRSSLNFFLRGGLPAGADAEAFPAPEAASGCDPVRVLPVLSGLGWLRCPDLVPAATPAEVPAAALEEFPVAALAAVPAPALDAGACLASVLPCAARSGFSIRLVRVLSASAEEDLASRDGFLRCLLPEECCSASRLLSSYALRSAASFCLRLISEAPYGVSVMETFGASCRRRRYSR